MSAHAKHGFNPASPILADVDCWLFEGASVDARVFTTEAEAQRHAEELNSDRQLYGVIKFNSVEGWIQNVTVDFWRAPEDEKDDGYEVTPLRRTAFMRRTGALR